MALEPKLTHTFPSERRYFDESTSTKAAATIFNSSKTGKDYGIEDLGATQEVSSSENGGGSGGNNGGETPPTEES